MSEILAALPRIFGARRGDDYAQFVRQANAERMATRALGDTQRQLTRAYERTLTEINKDKTKPAS